MSRYPLNPLQSRLKNRFLPIVLFLGGMLPGLTEGLIGGAIALFLSESLGLPGLFVAPLTALVSIGLVIVIILFLLSVEPVSRWFWRILPLNNQTTPQPTVKTLQDPAQGLILFASSPPRNPSPTPRPTAVEKAIDYHFQLSNPQLKHCWIICTTASIEATRTLNSNITSQAQFAGLQLYFERSHTVPDPKNPGQKLSLFIEEDERINDPEYIKRLIDGIYLAAQQEGISESDLIADFTGGTKPMTAGMILAGIAPGRRLAYFSQLKADQAAKTDLKEIRLDYKLKGEI